MVYSDFSKLILTYITMSCAHESDSTSTVTMIPSAIGAKLIAGRSSHASAVTIKPGRPVNFKHACCTGKV